MLNRVRTILTWTGRGAALLCCAALVVILAAPRNAGAQETDGKKVFLGQKCNACHTIESQGIAKDETKDAEGDKDEAEAPETGEKKDPPDLSNAGAERDKVWISKYLAKQEKIEGRKHKKRFRGTKDELKVVSEWLAGLKK